MGVAVGSAAEADTAPALGCDMVIRRDEIKLDDSCADDAARVVEVGTRLGSLIRRDRGGPHIAF